MMVPPLSERPVTEEDEEQFRRESMPRTYTLRQRWADYRAEAKANRPKGAKARVRAWLHVEPFYWGMRVTYVVLVVGAVFAVYINGVANGWWHAWGEKPTVAATTTPAPARTIRVESHRCRDVGWLPDRTRRRARAPHRTRRIHLHQTRTTRRSQRKHRTRSRTRSRVPPRHTHLRMEHRRHTTIRRHHATREQLPRNLH